MSPLGWTFELSYPDGTTWWEIPAKPRTLGRAAHSFDDADLVQIHALLNLAPLPPTPPASHAL